jgi:hypothetical protein
MVADVKPIDLRTLLEEINRESRKNRADKRYLSHKLANGLIEITRAKGAKLIEAGPGNANYFCAEIDGVQVAVSPFASHDGWWERVSEGFRSLGERRGCRWGVALFNLPEKRGVWFEGEGYDLHVLRNHETVNKIDAERAERLGIGQSFSNNEEFLRLLKEGIKKPMRTRLIRKTKKDAI